MHLNVSHKKGNLIEFMRFPFFNINKNNNSKFKFLDCKIQKLEIYFRLGVYVGDECLG